MRKLMVENKFDIICIQETILPDLRFDPDREYLWDCIPAHGRWEGRGAHRD
jgi:hypothetical protein